MVEKIDYEKRYHEISNQFWELQRVDKTDEELRYESLSRQLKELSRNYKDRFNQIECENEELQEKVSGFNEAKEKYESLLRRYENLVNLEKSYNQVTNL